MVSKSRPLTQSSKKSKSGRPANTLHRIIDLFRVPERYLRSVHLERDFDDIAALQHYVITPPMVAVFSRIVEGLHTGSGHRAWRITGDYGTGKSSFALMLAHLLCNPTAAVVERARKVMDADIERDTQCVIATPMVPILVVGAREPLVPAIARSLIHALERPENWTKRIPKDLRGRVEAVVSSGDASQLLDILDRLGAYAKKNGRSGILLIIDELGKFLEYASMYPDQEDLYVLQRLAEAASRSGDRPLIVLGLLHQGFHSYAERLHSTARMEWDKVAGRYEEITFDQPLSHVGALVAGALNIDGTLIPAELTSTAQDVASATYETGWYGTSHNNLSPLEIYPLHPMLLPVLVRFFARFGQNERSLFSFLLSSEPFGLQSFAERRAGEGIWYRLSDLYDYVRSAFGHRLAGASYSSHWLRIAGTLDRVAEVDDIQLRVLKTVALLNILDAEHLLANDKVLAAAITDGDKEETAARAVASLKNRGLLFYRGTSGGYCLWPSTSVNLESAFEEAQRVLGPIERVSAQLGPYFNETSVLARRHYIETGTMRHFEVRYAEPTELLEILNKPTDADGLVVFVLCETPDERKVVIEKMVSEISARPEVVLGVPPALQGLAADVQDVRRWQWVADNKPELEQDSYAASEVARQIILSRRTLTKRLVTLFGLQGGVNTKVEWWRGGQRIDFPTRGRISAMISKICDELYDKAPQIRNELLNRRILSSAAAAARLRLIERMFSAHSQPALGIEATKAPPEKSMYLSFLSAGKVHREEEERYILAEPLEDDDPLLLRPSLAQIFTLLKQDDGRRIPVTTILRALQDRPYGVRAGVAPVLIAIVIVAHAHEIAVYENGTFLQRFEGRDFLRLIKQPGGFEFQLCRVKGIRAEVFALLSRMIAVKRLSERELELLDVVRPLSAFAAQLPEYTRMISNLPEPAKAVRDALLTAREPTTLVFTSLPMACGFEPFLEDGAAEVERASQFVDTLRGAMADLQSWYPRLLERIRERILSGLSGGGTSPNRDQVANRASQIVIIAREPRLQTFARCLTDRSLSEDAWAEKIGSFVISKPPARWTSSDEARAGDEIDLLSTTFLRVEATAFSARSSEPDATAVRLGLTQGDGCEVATIVRISVEDEPAVRELTAKVESMLAKSHDLQLAAISRVLWNILRGNGRTNDETSPAEKSFYPSTPPGGSR